MTTYERRCAELDIADMIVERYLSHVDPRLFWEDKYEIDDAVIDGLKEYLSVVGVDEFIEAANCSNFVNYRSIAWKLFEKIRQANKDEAYQKGYARFY